MKTYKVSFIVEVEVTAKNPDEALDLADAYFRPSPESGTMKQVKCYEFVGMVARDGEGQHVGTNRLE